MSSQGFAQRSDHSAEKKIETVRLPAGALGGSHLAELLPQHVKAFAARPIAPAPLIQGTVSVQAAAHTVSVQGASHTVSVQPKFLAATPVQHHTVIPKALDPSGHQGVQPQAVNLTTQSSLAGLSTSQVLASAPHHLVQAMTSQNPQGALHALPKAVHDEAKEKARAQRIVTEQHPLASLIRPQQVIGGGSHSISVSGTVAALTQPVAQHSYPHLPRGAVQASSLTIPKPPSVATAVLRANPTGGAVTTVTGGLQTLPASLQRPGLIAKSTALPIAHSSASIATATLLGQDMGRMSGSHLTTTSAGTVQISLQQHQPTAANITGRTTLQQIPAGGATKTVGLPLQQQIQQMTPHKVMVSQVPTLVQQQSMASVNTAPSKIAAQNFALNLAQSQTQQRTHKLLTTPVAPSAANLHSSLANLTSQSLGITQNTMRTQKIVVTQAIPRPAPATQLTVTAGNKQAVSAALNLSQGSHPHQKMVMSHLTGTSLPSSAVVTMATKSQTAKIPPHTRHLSVMQDATPRDIHVPHPHTTTSQPHPTPVVTLFGSQGAARASPSVTATPGNLTVAAVSQPDSRTQTQDTRPGYATSHVPFTLQPEFYYNPLMSALPNMVYQHVGAQPTGTLQQGAAIRQAIVPAPTPSLAATLQAASHSSPVPGGNVGGAAAGVRLAAPSVMVNVDPSSHHLTMQYATDVAHSVSDTSVTGVLSGTPSAGHVSVSAAGVVSSLQPASSPIQQPNASPRPSILRKRNNDGVTVVKRNLLPIVSAVAAEAEMLAARTSPKPAPPCDPSRENSQSSTDTASSVESTPQSAANTEVKVKQEPQDVLENGLSALSMAGVVHGAASSIEASPRKKPRKQQLNVTVEMPDATDTDDEVEKLSAAAAAAAASSTQSANLDLVKAEADAFRLQDIKREELTEYVDDEGVKWVRGRQRPPIALLNHYQCTWKPCHNHFMRPTDVKPKEERRPTVNELANQKGVQQKASGWKVYHLAAQLEEMMDTEREVFSKMAGVQEAIAPKQIAKHPTMEDDISMVHELTQGNIQRCQLVMDQLEEARASMLKVLDHQSRVHDIISKHHSKRPVKKKERV